MNDHFYQIYLNISLRLWTVIGISNFLLDIFRKKACKGNHFYRISNFLNFSLDFSKFFFSIFLEKKKWSRDAYYERLSLSNFLYLSRRLWTVTFTVFRIFQTFLDAYERSPFLIFQTFSFLERKRSKEGYYEPPFLSNFFKLLSKLLFYSSKENEQKNKNLYERFYSNKKIFSTFSLPNAWRKSRSAPMNGRVYPSTRLASPAPAELCLVNEATSLIRIRTLINSPAEFSSSSRRLERRAYRLSFLPIHRGRTNGPGASSSSEQASSSPGWERKTSWETGRPSSHSRNPLSR